MTAPSVRRAHLRQQAWLASLIVAALLLALPATALAKSFSMPDVAIDATIGVDGSLAV
jgi:hypothetical protein